MSLNLYSSVELAILGVRHIEERRSQRGGIDNGKAVASSRHLIPPHQCGTIGEWFQVGKCVICEEQVATYMLLHEEGNVAHMVYCDSCFNKGSRQVCVCGAAISSMAVMDFAVCPEQCCLQVGMCLKADCESTATCWKETSRAEVSLGYCKPHMQEKRASDQSPNVRYGECSV